MGSAEASVDFLRKILGFCEDDAGVTGRDRDVIDGWDAKAIAVSKMYCEGRERRGGDQLSDIACHLVTLEQNACAIKVSET